MTLNAAKLEKMVTDAIDKNNSMVSEMRSKNPPSYEQWHPCWGKIAVIAFSYSILLFQLDYLLIGFALLAISIIAVCFTKIVKGPK